MYEKCTYCANNNLLFITHFNSFPDTGMEFIDRIFKTGKFEEINKRL